MSTVPKPEAEQLSAHRKAMIKIMEEVDAKAGIVYDPTVTVQQLREMMRAQGIRPEDNIFSRDIIRARYPDDEEDEI